MLTDEKTIRFCLEVLYPFTGSNSEKSGCHFIFILFIFCTDVNLDKKIERSEVSSNGKYASEKCDKKGDKIISHHYEKQCIILFDLIPILPFIVSSIPIAL